MKDKDHFNQSRCSRRNPSGGVFFGLILLGVGLAAMLDALNLFNFHNLFHFWPAIFLLIGVSKFAKSRRPAQVFSGLFFIGLAIIFTLHELGYLHLSWNLLWPAVLIFIGMKILLRSIYPTDSHAKFEFDQVVNNSDQFVKSDVIFGGSKLINQSQDFKGGGLSATMGGIELDLRSAQIISEAHIIVLVNFGGVEIRVPDDWVIVNRATATLGAVEDKTRAPVHSEKRLIISGAVSFGAVEIKN